MTLTPGYDACFCTPAMLVLGCPLHDPAACPDRPHRGPEGPNEDLAGCVRCGAVSHTMRPEGEEYGGHIPDCSLPRRHESFCVPGGAGHAPAQLIRGYFPPLGP